MVKKWNAELIIKFLEAYEENSCLWDVTSKNYKNWESREIAYSNISQEMDIKGFNTAEVRSKIRSLRNAYTLELAKIAKSKKFGEDEDNIYKTKLKWFPVADRILHGVVQFRDSPSKQIKNEEIIQAETLATDEDDVINSQSTISESPTPTRNTIKCQQTSPIASKRPKMNKEVEQSSNEIALEDPQDISKKLEASEENEFDCFGKSVACHLKKLPESVALESMAYLHSYLVKRRLKYSNDN